jgi:hypothetical protein
MEIISRPPFSAKKTTTDLAMTATLFLSIPKSALTMLVPYVSEVLFGVFVVVLVRCTQHWV